MSKALYSEKRSGHFGLALSHYSHFTSPIRRYPDLQIHRILKSYLHKQADEREKRRYETLLPRVAKDCSTYERRAERLEYDYRDLKIAIYLKNREGEVFQARITTILENGYFVEFLPHIEGFVRGKPPGKIFHTVTVRLSFVDIRGRKIDCEAA